MYFLRFYIICLVFRLNVNATKTQNWLMKTECACRKIKLVILQSSTAATESVFQECGLVMVMTTVEITLTKTLITAVSCLSYKEKLVKLFFLRWI